jgi:hypothetical protein
MGEKLALWELDPLFSAAEDVQHSADKMDSAYRAWIHGHGNQIGELITAFETTKWQLEEFERAFTKECRKDYRSGGALARYRPFIEAIRHHISLVESNLRISGIEQDSRGLHVISMGDGDRDEFANFLLGNKVMGSNDKNGYIYPSEECQTEGGNVHSYYENHQGPLTCEHRVSLNRDVQEGAQTSTADELHQSPVFGSQLYDFEGKTSISVSSPELKGPVINDRLLLSANRSFSSKNSKRTDFDCRNESIGNGLLDWEDGVASNADKVKEPGRYTNKYQSWNSWFLSIGQHLGGKLLHSKSGVKRYKDGESDSIANSQKETFIGSLRNGSAFDFEKGESSKLSTSGRRWNGISFILDKVKQSAVLRKKSEQKMLHSRPVRFVHTVPKYFLVLLVIIAIGMYFWFLSRSMVIVTGVVRGN